MDKTIKLLTPFKVRETVWIYARKPDPVTFSEGTRGAIIGRMNAILKGGSKKASDGDQRRYNVFGFLFSPDEAEIAKPLRSEDLTPQEWNGLFRWMGGSWQPGAMRKEFAAELRWVANLAPELFNLSAKGICPSVAIMIAELEKMVDIKEGIFDREGPVLAALETTPGYPIDQGEVTLHGYLHQMTITFGEQRVSEWMRRF